MSQQPLTGPRSFVIGTDPSCDMVIADQYASRRHARVTLYPDGTVTAEDLGSVNGTYLIRSVSGYVSVLAGEKVSGPVEVRPGDALRVGRTVIPWTPSKSSP